MKYDEFVVRDRLGDGGRFVFPPGSQIFRRSDNERHYPPIGDPVGWTDFDNDGKRIAGAVVGVNLSDWRDWVTCLVRIPALDQPAESTDEAPEAPEASRELRS